ncbi:hypothetical protein FIV42_27635 [Persicimonas caeni]|uniref:IPT/TIG domain-containing protein n=1 Tax=Persicimonas caeni TaxID=2292766 RepID=A0A4Y6Q1P0_PERCE|nr:hypothetical protein [Persicimonas caeni]QDG54379.1 hypothetical protein FIV42_27635 [Persicimonas caeni]QED35600.1 hypothetical protein FRD00_27630 [Persicimonas caeni]
MRVCSKRLSKLRGVLSATALLALGFASACSEDVEGPEPSLEAPAADQEPLPIEPGIVCADQLTTTVTVTGQNFSPLVIDSLEDESRIEYPTISLDRMTSLTGEEAEAANVTYSGDPDNPTNRGLLKWQSQEQMTFTVNPELTLADGTTGPLPTGILDVTVTNANDNEAVSQGALAVAPKPELTDLAPDVVCLTEGDRTVTVSGSTFLEIAGQTPTVAVVPEEGEAKTYDVSFADENCQNIAHEGIDARTCSAGDITLPQGDIAPGYPALTLNNPETAQCNSEETINLRVVPPPTIDTIAPPMACVAQSERTFEISGSDFLTINGELPTVTVDGTEFDVTASDCSPLEALNSTIESCTTLTMVVPEGAVDPGRQPVVVTNPEPAGCSNQDQAYVTIVPPPTVDEVRPPAVCVDDGPRDVTIVGSGFITVVAGNGLELPTVTFDGTAVDPTSIAPQDCSALVVDGMDVQSCNELVVTVSDAELAGTPPFNPEVSVTNPDPAGCSDTQQDLLTVLEGPTLESAEPALACTDEGARDVVLTGTNFLTVDGTVPTVTLDGVAVDSANVAASDCAATANVAGGLTVEACTTLTLSLPQGTLAAGDTQVEVINPNPVGCSVSDSTILTVPPTLAIASVTPANVCSTSTGTNSIEISGSGFLKVDGQWFTLDIGGQSIAIDDSKVSDCTALTVDGQTAESCGTITVDVDTSGFSEGPIDVTIDNPGVATCDATISDKFGIAPPPTVTSVQPANVCADTASVITVNGADFAQGATVTAIASDGTRTQADTVTFVSSTELEAEFSAGLTDGSYDIEVDNGQSCSGLAADALVVNPLPVVFFVDPPVLYNGIDTQVTIFTSGLAAAPSSLELVDSTGTATTISSYSSPEPNRILATVPSGLTADSYEVRVTSQFGCTGGLPGAVEVTDQTTVQIASIDPTFGWQNSPTSVTITADENAPTANQFKAVPRVYLNPATSTSGATATELRAATFNSATELSGIVPPGLDVGEYDIIVVNPDGTVGILTDPNNTPGEGAFEVLLEAPPVIDSVNPGTWPDNEISSGAIRGENFRLDETTNSEPITVECVGPTGTSFTIDPLAIDVDWTTYNASTAQEQSTTIPFTVDLNNATVEKGAVCVATVTNTDDTFAEFAPVAISWPASAWRLGPFQAGPDMLTARRTPVANTGQPSREQRFLYAIGGDDGTADNAFDTVEFARLDRLGNPLAFETMPRHSLPAGGLTLTKSVRIDDFIYVVGGYKGTGATTTGATGEVLRAKVLDPLNVPDISDVDFEVDAGNGLTEGTYYYRVAAVLNDTPAQGEPLYNPGGETLASEPLPLAVPAPVSGDLVPTITWDAFPDATSYRIYRSPSPNTPFGQEVLIGEVTDNGSSTYSLRDPNLAQVNADNPLPIGSLGEWHQPDPNATITARHSHGLTIVEDPSDPTLHHIYAAGGVDATDTALADIDYVTIQVNGPLDQTIQSVTTNAATLSGARFENSAAMATSKSATNLSNPPILYVMGGQTGAGLTNDVDYYSVGAGGTLGARQTFDTRGMGSFAGYVGGVANNHLFLIHGQGGLPNQAATKSAELLSTGQNQAPWWSNLTVDGSIEDRYLPGSTPLFGIMYVLGGVGTNNAILQSTDYSVVGATSE